MHVNSKSKTQAVKKQFSFEILIIPYWVNNSCSCNIESKHWSITTKNVYERRTFWIDVINDCNGKGNILVFCLSGAAL